ncbi:MAG: ABC transporter ATP-binding protein [Saprospiraceae bacterium]|nr:ABC transporter ATP-binding protein [Saprospiraceae bacterium]
MTTNKIVVDIHDVYKTYHETKVPVEALRGVTIQIRQGEFTAIVGPSGSGKTTLLNIIGGLDRPTKGKIIVDGTDLSNLSENQLIDFRKTHIGFVFQSYNLIPVLTAKENVEFVMLLQNIDQEKRDKRTHELMEAVGLGDRMSNKPAELSGGQQQRVAVARALAPKPAFVLADEPTANLDSASTSNLLDIMARLNAEEGITFVFSTHDQRVIDRARRVITIEDGKVLSDILK